MTATDRWTPPPADTHSPDCTAPGWRWQAEILPGLQRIGTCRCGAVTVNPPRPIRGRNQTRR